MLVLFKLTSIEVFLQTQVNLKLLLRFSLMIRMMGDILNRCPQNKRKNTSLHLFLTESKSAIPPCFQTTSSLVQQSSQQGRAFFSSLTSLFLSTKSLNKTQTQSCAMLSIMWTSKTSCCPHTNAKNLGG